MLAAALLGASAVVQQLRMPKDERTWHGRIVGVPYDFRPPTFARVRERLWNPQAGLFTPHVFGIGWTLNLYRVTHPAG